MFYRTFLAALFAILFVTGILGWPSVVLAEETCSCYCAIEGTGATQKPYVNTKVTADQCKKFCLDEGSSVAVCAYKPNQKPQYNLSCFKPDECIAQGGIRTATGTGDPTQPGECIRGMYYCYPNPATRQKAALQVSIAGLTVSGDLGEYISYVYKWMLGAGTTIAIIFIMVAGLRWTLGGVSAEQIGKAKKTITNAMIGLVLLMSTYLIIFTVNPYLVRLQVPAFPMIKGVSLVGKDSCGYLSGQWGDGSTGHYPYLIANGAPLDSPYAGASVEKRYELANHTNGEACGSIADVVEAPDGETLQANMTCAFDYCPDKDKVCVVTIGGGTCYSCADFGYNNNLNISITSEYCARFKECIFVSKDTFTTSLADYFNASEDFIDWTRDTFCYSCKGKTCSSYNSDMDLCISDPCKLGCEIDIIIGDEGGGATMCVPKR